MSGTQTASEEAWHWPPGPGACNHWRERHGIVNLTETGAHQHLDALASRYTTASRYFGEGGPSSRSDVQVSASPARRGPDIRRG